MFRILVLHRVRLLRLLLFDDELGLLDEIERLQVVGFVLLAVGRRLGELHQIGVAQDRRKVHPGLVGQLFAAHRLDDLVGGHLHGAHAPARRDVGAQDVRQSRIILLVPVVLP